MFEDRDKMCAADPQHGRYLTAAALCSSPMCAKQWAEEDFIALRRVDPKQQQG